MVSIITVIEEDQFREGINFLISNSTTCSITATFTDYDNLIKYLFNKTPDLILFDIDISLQGAVTTIKKIKSLNETIIIIALTGIKYDNDNSIYNIICAGADGFIKKDISHPELIEALNEACLGGSPLSSDVAKKLVSFFQQNAKRKSSENSYNLSPREREVITLLADGKSLRDVASSLLISIDTVRFHSKNIYRKLRVRNQAELVAKTLRENII